eukprot:54766-Rhodomonas_salina.2
MDEADAVLDSVSARDLQGVKAVRTPPAVIRVIFDAVLLLKLRPMNKIQVASRREKAQASRCCVLCCSVETDQSVCRAGWHKSMLLRDRKQRMGDPRVGDAMLGADTAGAPRPGHGREGDVDVQGFVPARPPGGTQRLRACPLRNAPCDWTLGLAMLGIDMRCARWAAAAARADLH